MAVKDNIFTSKVKYTGIYNFKDYYAFCYTWLREEFGLDVNEAEYFEKLEGPVKGMMIKWVGTRDVSDYFRYMVEVKFQIIAMSDVEITQGGVKMKTNKGEISTSVKGFLVKDYQGKFETSAKMKIWRGIYEKWIISQRVKQFEDKLVGDCDEFLGQAKAFLDLEGRK